MALDFSHLFDSNVITTSATLKTDSGDHVVNGMFVDEFEAAEILEIEIESSKPFFEMGNDDLPGDEKVGDKINVSGFREYKIFDIQKLSEPITRFVLSYDS